MIFCRYSAPAILFYCHSGVFVIQASFSLGSQLLFIWRRLFKVQCSAGLPLLVLVGYNLVLQGIWWFSTAPSGSQVANVDGRSQVKATGSWWASLTVIHSSSASYRSAMSTPSILLVPQFYSRLFGLFWLPLRLENALTISWGSTCTWALAEETCRIAQEANERCVMSLHRVW